MKPGPSKRATANVENIQFERPLSSIALFFLVVPAAIIVMFLTVAITHRLPFVLMALLSVVGAACMMLIIQALPALGPVTVKLSPEGLAIKRMLGSTLYPWSNIESIKAAACGPTLADSGRLDDGRVGLCLYLATNNAAGNAADREPDEIIVSGVEGFAADIAKAIKQIEVYRRKITGGGDSGKRIGLGAKAPFRRPSTANAA